MSEEIIKVLDNLGQKFGLAIDWSSQNIMPYLQDLMSRFIAYRTTTAIILIVISLVLIIGGLISIKKLRKWIKSDAFNKRWQDDDDLLAILGFTGAGILVTVGIVVLIFNIFGIVQNLCMPELVVFKYIKNLI